jgi:endonuclease/exonuclease/phosphatase family metal-dependent hydrolase
MSLTPTTLRIATLNIWNKSGPWAERRLLIRGELERLEAGVVGLQEVLRLAPRGAAFGATVENCQATELADGLGYEVLYRPACDYSHGFTFGNALLTRYPIVEDFSFELPQRVPRPTGALRVCGAPDEADESRVLVGALLETPFGRLPVFVTHLNWKLHHGAVRFEQVRFIVERIFEIAPLESPLLPPVLMGDFNADPDSDEIRFLRGLKVSEGKSVFFADAWVYAGDGTAGATFCRSNDYARVAREPSRRIDYVFVRGPDALLRGEPVHAELAFAAPETRNGASVWPSDHFGLVTDVVFAPRSP